MTPQNQKFSFSRQPRVLLIEARFYPEIADALVAGALDVFKSHGIAYDRIVVPGALEIPCALRLVAGHFDAYVVLGCVIRGQTSHYEIVSEQSARGLMDVSVRHGLPVGNGILTCENTDQAYERSDPARGNTGGRAAYAALCLLDIQIRFPESHAVLEGFPV